MNGNNNKHDYLSGLNPNQLMVELIESVDIVTEHLRIIERIVSPKTPFGGVVSGSMPSMPSMPSGNCCGGSSIPVDPFESKKEDEWEEDWVRGVKDPQDKKKGE
jgi:hypothetical protein